MSSMMPTEWFKAIEKIIQIANETPSKPNYMETGTTLELDQAVWALSLLGPQACLRGIQESHRIEDEQLCALVIGDLTDGMRESGNAQRTVIQFLSGSTHPVHWHCLCLLAGNFLSQVDKGEVTNALQTIRKKGDQQLKSTVDYTMKVNGLKPSLFSMF